MRRSVLVLVLMGMIVPACGDDEPDTRPGARPDGSRDTALATAVPTSTTAPDDTDATTGATGGTPPTAAPGTEPTAVLPTPRVGEAAAAFEQPVDLAVRPDDTALYVVERVGRVTAWRDGDTVTVLDVTELTEATGERGLLGLAFSADGDLAWINHTDLDGDTVIAEYGVADDGRFDASTRRTVLTIDQPHPNHNGGDLVLGPDGHLYIGTGDGGSADDPDRVALDTGNLLGKILRIDPAPRGDSAYTVPDDNPFVDAPGSRPEVWTIGVRNPWRFSFDSETGDLWIADVGQGAVEEIDVLSADADGAAAGRGASLGWSAFEGDQRTNEDQPADGHTAPFFVYTHDAGRCSVSGGVVARGSSVPGLDGWYLFGDWCTGEVWAIEVQRTDSGARPGRLVDVGTVPQVVNVVAGHDGDVWALSLEGGLYPIVD